MPYTTEWKKGGVWWTFSGKVTGEEILQVNLDIYGDERLDRLKFQFVDFSRAESFEVTEAQVKRIAYLDRAASLSNPLIKVAIVAPQDVIRELANLYSEYSEASSWETALFENSEQAMEWLGL